MIASPIINDPETVSIAAILVFELLAFGSSGGIGERLGVLEVLASTGNVVASLSPRTCEEFDGNGVGGGVGDFCKKVVGLGVGVGDFREVAGLGWAVAAGVGSGVGVGVGAPGVGVAQLGPVKICTIAPIIFVVEHGVGVGVEVGVGAPVVGVGVAVG